jgi:hypothetical protein
METTGQLNVTGIDINDLSSKVAIDRQMLEVALDMLGMDTTGLLRRSIAGAVSQLQESRKGA